MAKNSTTGGKSKTAIVQELIARGITVPREISELAKSEFQVDITPGHASNIKSTLGKGKKGKRKAVVRGNRVVTAPAAASTTSKASAGSDVSIENLALRFALKAGSIDKAISVLEKLRQQGEPVSAVKLPEPEIY